MLANITQCPPKHELARKTTMNADNMLSKLLMEPWCIYRKENTTQGMMATIFLNTQTSNCSKCSNLSLRIAESVATVHRETSNSQEIQRFHLELCPTFS